MGENMDGRAASEISWNDGSEACVYYSLKEGREEGA